MTKDPLGEDGGINLYGFVENDPINFIDPYGLESVALPGPVPLPFVLPKTEAQKQADKRIADGLYDVWMDHVHPPLMATGDFLYQGGMGEWLYDQLHPEEDSNVCEMSKPNRKKQGRELDEKKRKKNWIDNGNRRNGRTQKKHTPSRKHKGGKKKYR